MDDLLHYERFKQDVCYLKAMKVNLVTAATNLSENFERVTWLVDKYTLPFFRFNLDGAISNMINLTKHIDLLNTDISQYLRQRDPDYYKHELRLKEDKLIQQLDDMFEAINVHELERKENKFIKSELTKHFEEKIVRMRSEQLKYETYLNKLNYLASTFKTKSSNVLTSEFFQIFATKKVVNLSVTRSFEFNYEKLSRRKQFDEDLVRRHAIEFTIASNELSRIDHLDHSSSDNSSVVLLSIHSINSTAFKSFSGTNPFIPATATQEVSVYVTRTGSCYHKNGCGYLWASKIPMHLETARKKYVPCSRCCKYI
jgi:hypothetical protein